ncbi:MAG TPA: PrsW family glutamic-type intramembrane protease, partial [Polyangiaceae bacterium]|nr:PrsW family glutamic-type intramembrane protease [Polyangiaceae bacterium]
MLAWLSFIALAALPLAAAIAVFRLGSRRFPEPRRVALGVVIGGGIAALAAVHLEQSLLELSGLSLDAMVAGVRGALLATFLLAAPLEEAAKVAVVWPLFRARRISDRRSGVLYAVCAAAGFAAVEVVLVRERAGSMPHLRLLAGMCAHLFFAGVWGYALGGGGRTRGRYFGVAWLAAMALHGLYLHIVFGRGPAVLVLTLPMLAAMALVSWLAFREIAAGRAGRAGRAAAPLSGPEPASLRTVRRALRRRGRPLMVHWIAVGVFVTIGLMLACLALAVYLGHRVGVDFALVDEADVRSSGPLLLLGAAVLFAFPLAGYLVARASAAQSVLEPALGAGIAIGLVVFMLSVTAPVAVVFALAMAPIAFALACGGAWFGLSEA